MVRVPVHAVPRDLAVSAAVYCALSARMATMSSRSRIRSAGWWLVVRTCWGCLRSPLSHGDTGASIHLASFGYFGFLLLLAPDVVVCADSRRGSGAPAVPAVHLSVADHGGVPAAMEDVSRCDDRYAWRRFAPLRRVLSYQRNQVWSSALAFWEDTAAKSPANARARFQLAYAQWQNGQCAAGGRATTRRSPRLQTPDDRLLIDWAYALDCVGNGRRGGREGSRGHRRSNLPAAHGYAADRHDLRQTRARGGGAARRSRRPRRRIRISR